MIHRSVASAHKPTTCFQAHSGSTEFRAVSWDEGRSSEEHPTWVGLRGTFLVRVERGAGYRRGWRISACFKCEGHQRSRVQVAFPCTDGLRSSSAELMGPFWRHRPQTCLRGMFDLCFHTSLALQSAGAKVASHINLISYTLKVDILCKLAAWLRQSLRVRICSVFD